MEERLRSLEQARQQRKALVQQVCGESVLDILMNIIFHSLIYFINLMIYMMIISYKIMDL